jgi:hypothetical protein
MAANMVEVTFTDGRLGCFSYGVPVAARDTKGNWYCTNVRYSLTTTKHMNFWANPKLRKEISDHELRKMLLPVRRAK